MNKAAITTIAVLVAMTGCDTKELPIQLEKYCVSDSGLSNYLLTLNTSDRSGTIRYQYMGQDVQYVVKTMDVDGRRVTGRADFQSSLTGESHGNPMEFIYDGAPDTLKDGASSASCQNREANEQG